MSDPYPALRARFGDTDYYLTSMLIEKLNEQIKFPADLPDWDKLGLEEKFQRKLDLRRIKNEIAPYFANDPNRFSGSLVLAVKSNKKMTFEQLDKFVGAADSIPELYNEAVKDMGFCIIPKDAILIPLDGQHRAKAFALVVKGDSDRRDDGSTIPNNDDLRKEKVAVILVDFNQKKARHIFNKINKYAKPTTKATKLITDDDDSMAVIVRRMIEGGVIPERLVSLDKNALNKKTHEFTTLATFYDANMHLLGTSRIRTITKPEKIPPDEIKPRFEELKKEWFRLLAGIKSWKKSLEDPTEKGDKTRIKMRQEYISNRPIGQLALVGGYAFASKRNERINKDVLVERLNKIDWRPDKKTWLGILLKPNGKIMAGTPAKKNAIKFIAYLIGAELTKEERGTLMRFIYGDEWRKKRLPERIK